MSRSSLSGTPMTGKATSRARQSPKFDAILFDLFGTLIPTGAQTARTANLKEMAKILKVDPDDFARSWMESFDQRARGELGPLEHTIERLAAERGAHPSLDAVQRAASVRMGFAQELLDSSAPVLSALDALREAGVRLAVVSDTSDETPRLWSDTVLAHRFEVAVFSCQEGVRKPDPRMYQRALSRLGMPASRCAFVGDGGSNELTGASAVGLSAFMYRFPDEDEVRAFRVDADVRWSGTRLSDLTELLHLPGGKPGDSVSR